MLRPQNIGSEPNLFKKVTTIRKNTNKSYNTHAPSNDKACHFFCQKKGNFTWIKRNYNVFRGKESYSMYLLSEPS